ncbi:protein shisa-9 [Lates japonicus]|uniref:Protein shisa-9 n=1 Tax=Lates japonicus TaxID=270547 RepID=A0AAD3NFF5_LATJO|nr:protein shisa-9 [Lates japonicus]
MATLPTALTALTALTLMSASSKPDRATLALMAGTMPGGMSLGISRAAETAIDPSSATMGRPLAYSSNTIAAGHGMGLGLKAWDGTETVGRRKTYGHKRPQCTVLEPNQLHGSRGHSHSQHFLPTQPYFETNSKTEVHCERRRKGEKREERMHVEWWHK